VSESGRALLVLTTTVSPSADVARLAIVDPAIRLEEYRRSAATWAAAAAPASLELLVADSSVVATAEVAKLAAHVHGVGGMFVHLPSELASPDKGAREAELVERVNALATIEQYEHVIKCTGRLTVRNASACLGQRHGDICLSLYSDLRRCDSRLLYGRPASWRRLWAGTAAEVDERVGVYLEDVLTRRLMHEIAHGSAWYSWPSLPVFSGRSGSTGERYDSPLGLTRRQMHQWARRVLLRRRLVL
jgi:hypothetical protein